MSTQLSNQENAIRYHLFIVFSSFCGVIFSLAIISSVSKFIFGLSIRPLLLHEDVANVYRTNFFIFGPGALVTLLPNKREYYEEKTHKIDENFKDLYMLKKAEKFHMRREYTNEWNLLSELSKSETKYKYVAKFWMANCLLYGQGVKKDEERALKYLKDAYKNHIERHLQDLEDTLLCIDFINSDCKPLLISYSTD
ncbi:1722_t:CDS:2 [Dentiscutata erythropus]|uniref:1722_t:CDS:1 n=1 Tax=Dentiscutata erythropus TaxID=1348616 RepID=A0A9N9C5M7_9GLOM|nr:1722_t:CDS:2 [Dentiscutata erythropus]